MPALLNRITTWGWIGTLLTLYVLIYACIPTTMFIHVKSVTVEEVKYEGQPSKQRPLIIDRVIHLPFKGEYRVWESWKLNDHWVNVTVCDSPAVVDYRTDAALPNPVTAGWWAYGDCEIIPTTITPPDAELKLCTVHKVWILPLDIAIFKKDSEPVCSNTYQGRLLPPPEI